MAFWSRLLQGKIITSAGVSSGIELGIHLVALLTDELTAKAAQLLIEYDPQPPFDAGSVEKAGPQVVQKVLALYEDLTGASSGEISLDDLKKALLPDE